MTIILGLIFSYYGTEGVVASAFYAGWLIVNEYVDKLCDWPIEVR